jgi:uncharacterized phage-associated protein
MKTIQLQKAVDALNYLIQKSSGHEINKLHLMKLVWAADRYHLRKFGRLVTGDSYVAMPRGPVASLILDIINADDFLSEGDLEYSKQYIELNSSSHNVKSILISSNDSLSKSDTEALDFSWSTFGTTSRFDLVDITHQYPEWKRHEPTLANIRTSIPMDLRDFFKNPKIENDPFEVDEKLLGANLQSFVSNSDFKQIFQ